MAAALNLTCLRSPLRQIHFVDFKKGADTKLGRLLARYFDAPTTAWLLREMEDNRDKGLAASKAYSFPQLRWVGGWVAAVVVAVVL
jgi:hypothetical protein